MQDNNRPEALLPDPELDLDLELDFDHIMAEFSAEAPAQEEPEPAAEENQPVETAEEVSPEPADIKAEESTLIIGPLGAPTDTVRISPEEIRAALEQQNVTGDTVVLDSQAVRSAAPEADSDATVRFQPVTEMPEKAEPYSDEWEPEYDSPMGEYIPPRPILFHPRSRLRELKKKLIAGPEKRYYELTELGLGKLQVAIFFTALLVVVSVVCVVLHHLDMVDQRRLKMLIFGELFVMLLCGLIGCYRLLRGLSSMLRGRFTMEALLFLTFAVCMADGIVCLSQLRVPYSAVFCLEMLFAQLAAYHRRVTELNQMDTMRKATNLSALVPSANGFRDKSVLLRRNGEVEDFMDLYDAVPLPQKMLQIYGLCAFLLSFAAAAASAWLHGMAHFTQVWAAALLCAVPASAFVLYSRPMALVEKHLNKLDTVLCGWQGVKALSGKHCFPLTDSDLFPAGSVKMNGVKFYGDLEPDEVLACATALIRSCGGSLEPLFTSLLDSRTGKHYTAENLRSYPGGVGGEIDGVSVLVGTAALLRQMGVEVPKGAKLGQAVYAAVDGQLGGIFAISYGKDRLTAAGVSVLCSDSKITPILAARDFMLSEKFIQNRFKVRTKRLVIPESQEREALLALEPNEELPAAALTTRDSMAGLAYAAAGAHSLYSASILGLWLHILGGIIGLGAIAALGILGSVSLITPGSVVLYCLVWIVPGLLLTEWGRHI